MKTWLLFITQGDQEKMKYEKLKTYSCCMSLSHLFTLLSWSPCVHKSKEQLTVNRPADVGMCLLDLSKTLMYDFHQNYVKIIMLSRCILIQIPLRMK